MVKRTHRGVRQLHQWDLWRPVNTHDDGDFGASQLDPLQVAPRQSEGQWNTWTVIPIRNKRFVFLPHNSLIVRDRR